MIILKDLEQGSQEWLDEKLGKPSASHAKEILTITGKKSASREGYLYTLADEIVSGVREESYKNQYMDVGNEREDESRSCFEVIQGVNVDQVGVIYPDEDRKYLCSPDGIVNNEFGVELKNVKGSTQVKYLLKGKVPTEYAPQIQMSLLVTGFKFWYFCSYKPGLKPLILKVERDEKYISDLKVELDLFCEDLKAVVEKIK